MNTQRISTQALSIIEQYSNFKVGTGFANAGISIPYFNNRKLGLRGGLPSQVGKGSPRDIFEELELIRVKEKVILDNLDAATLKQFLIAHSIGIDCSGFAYYVLNEESRARNKGNLDRHLTFVFAGNLLKRLMAKLHPAKNADARTFASDKNSTVVQLRDAAPGDFITMVGNEDKSRDHIIVIHQVEYQNFIPTTLHYTHSIAWPTDGEYSHGVRTGRIEILSIEKPLSEQRWIEQAKQGSENYTFVRAQSSLTELRRLLWF